MLLAVRGNLNLQCALEQLQFFGQNLGRMITRLKRKRSENCESESAEKRRSAIALVASEGLPCRDLPKRDADRDGMSRSLRWFTLPLNYRALQS